MATGAFDGARDAPLWPAPLAGMIAAGASVLVFAVGDRTEAGRVSVVAGSLAVAAAALIFGALARDIRVRALILATAAFAVFAWTFVGAFSFGVLLAPGTLLALLAANRAMFELRTATAWLLTIIAAVVGVGGTALAIRLI